MGLRCNFHFLQLSPTQSPVLSQALFYRIFKCIAMHKSNKFFFKIFFLFYSLKCHTPPIFLFHQGLEKKYHLIRSCVITKELHDNLQKLAFIFKKSNRSASSIFMEWEHSYLLGWTIANTFRFYILFYFISSTVTFSISS